MARWVLLGICVLFGTYVVLQLLPAGRRRRRAPGAVERAERARAAAATTPRDRATALAAAASAAAQERRWTRAAGLYLRALRADPTAIGIAPDLVATVGGRRPRLAESILWRRLAAVPDDDAHRAAAAEIASSLAGLYASGLRDRARAEVLRRLAARLAAPG